MKHMLAALILMSVCGTTFADSLILKSGKKVEWKALRDKGNQYEVELLDGSIQVVLKKDVERVELFDVQPVLMGASISFSGKTKTVDLLGAFNQKRDVVFGVVKGVGSSLQVRSEIDAPTIAKLPLKLPEEYDVTIILERKSDIGNFYVGLTSGDRSFMVDFDTDRGSSSQILGSTTRRGAAFEKGRSHVLLIQVRREALLVTLDKKEFLSHKGAVASLSSGHQLPNNEISAFIGTQRIYGNAEHASFVVSRLSVTFQP
jgi:hypothetical protein